MRRLLYIWREWGFSEISTGRQLWFHQLRELNDQRGDAEYLRLLGRHKLQLSACIHAIVPSWHDAEDIFQETKIRLWEQFDRFQPGSDFLAWATTIARYLAKAHFKRNQRRPCLLSEDVASAVLKRLVNCRADNNERLEALCVCVGTLDGRALNLLRRRYFDLQSVHDIAAALRRTLPATYSAVSRIRRSLFDCVRSRAGKEGLR